MKDEKTFTGKFAVKTMEKETKTNKTNSDSDCSRTDLGYIPDWFAISSPMPDKES